MTMYNKSSAEPPHEKADFERRLDSFFSGEPLPPADTDELSLGASTEEQQRRAEAELDAALALLDDDAEIPAEPNAGRMVAPLWTPEELAAGDYEVIRHEGALTPYDRAFVEVRRLEEERLAVEPGSDAERQVIGDLAQAKGRLKLETKRSTDDTWRQRRTVDEWRRGIGRDEYNASRRKVRTRPNRMTPKDVLAAMTPEEREQHKKAKDADRKWIARQRRKGLTEEEIEAGLERRREERQAERAYDYARNPDFGRF